nr:ATP-binding protein [Methylobacterium sp. DB0501]
MENLVDNGVRYGSRARIDLRIEATTLIMRVDDDGPGIPSGDVAPPLSPSPGWRARAIATGAEQDAG